MFGKLLKYEWRATRKWYSVLFLVLAAVSVISLIILAGTIGAAKQSVDVGTESYPSWTSFFNFAVLLMLFASTSFGVSTTNIVITIARFYRNLFGREGYLTWTLPVTVHQILLSKFLMALFWTCLSIFAIILYLAALVLTGFLMTGTDFFSIIEFLNQIDQFCLFLILCQYIFATASSILLYYLAMAIGHLFNSYRILWSFLFGFLISTGLGILGLLFSSSGPFNFFHYATIISENQASMLPFYLSIGFSIFLECLKITGFYLVIAHIVKNNLNLQ